MWCSLCENIPRCTVVSAVIYHRVSVVEFARLYLSRPRRSFESPHRQPGGASNSGTPPVFFRPKLHAPRERSHAAPSSRGDWWYFVAAFQPTREINTNVFMYSIVLMTMSCRLILKRRKNLCFFCGCAASGLPLKCRNVPPAYVCTFPRWNAKITRK